MTGCPTATCQTSPRPLRRRWVTCLVSGQSKRAPCLVSGQYRGLLSMHSAALSMHVTTSHGQLSGVMLQQFKIFMADDQALLHAARAHWVLVPAAAARKRGDLDEIDSCDVAGGGDAGCNDAFLRIALPEGSVQLSSGEVHVGSDPNSNVHVDCSQVVARPTCHTHIWQPWHVEVSFVVFERVAVPAGDPMAVLLLTRLAAAGTWKC